MKKKMFAALMAACMTVSVFGSVVTASAADGVTLTLYGNADDLAKPYMQKIISLWEESSGNKIDQQGLDTDNAETIALTKFTTGDIPDLYIHFGNSNLKNFNPEENFVDWSDADWVSDIQDSVLPQATYNDKVIGLPFWEASNSGCFYNTKIFEELELSSLQHRKNSMQPVIHFWRTEYSRFTLQQLMHGQSFISSHWILYLRSIRNISKN